MNKLKILKEYFGHKQFREFQEEVIDSILNKQDTLLILPTGGGKSLCYQLPTMLLNGVTVVISPLLALMHDQVVALNSIGINAAMINSMQTNEEIKEIEKKLLKQEIKIVYITPERLQNSYFLSFLKKLNINFFVIDEAHCLSEWGHEFRNDYRKLSLLKEFFPNTPIAAFTATATKIVENDIVKSLKLQNPKILRGKVFRKNLTIKVLHRIRDGKSQLLEFLKNYKNESGIIYTLSRKATETLADFLQGKGIKAKPYHAGLSTEIKNKIYNQFINDQIDIVVATIAFGMGIDKSNIRFVIHMNLPKTIENFYQEIGRAGRDGLESETLLLYNTNDIIQQKNFIKNLSDSTYKKSALDKLNQIVKFANTQICRHKYIANYFNDTIEMCKNRCDNCLTPNKETIDITIEAQKLLSAIYRTEQNYGLHYVVNILRGSNEQRIIQNRHNQLSVYGIGKDLSKSQWLTIGDRLLEIEAIYYADFKVCKLTKIGIDIIKNRIKVSINEDRLSIKKQKNKLTSQITIDNYNKEIFEKLRELRLEISKKESIPPYIVFSDKTLKQLSTLLPKTKEEMLKIHGIGEIKYQKYGKIFLDYIRNFTLSS